MTFDEALSYLLSLGHETLTIKLGLKNTETLLNALGNPHKEFAAVQIAGTNGKGSVAVTLDSICHQAGIPTGLFTSPHLVSITQRIRINHEPISESDFARLTAQVKDVAHNLVSQRRLEALPTFFEHVTAIALLAFREAKIELGILETGLGGRLDSTTAAGANVVAITPIAMDHQEYLGHTLSEIAAEKAAIIRPGVAAIIAPQPERAMKMVLHQCDSAGVKPILVESWPLEVVEKSTDGRFCINLATTRSRYETVWLGLRGRHQIPNASTAAALAESLADHGFAISPEAIVRGIKNARHPGRLELWSGPQQILFDGAHNPAAARALRDYLDEFVQSPITIIFGAMRDKALEDMAGILFPRASALILTEFNNPRAASLNTMKSVIPDGVDQTSVHHATSVDEAIRIANAVSPVDNLICVTGSLYLVGAIQQSLKSKKQRVAEPHGSN